jgi:hypothetical protein
MSSRASRISVFLAGPLVESAERPRPSALSAAAIMRRRSPDDVRSTATDEDERTPALTAGLRDERLGASITVGVKC